MEPIGTRHRLLHGLEGENGRTTRSVAPEDRRSPIRGQDVTQLLLAWGDGDQRALERLVPLVYDELRRIARRCMRAERAENSLQATALVNEAYLRLVNVQQVRWQNRAHLLAMSARLMRRVLVDHARAKAYRKRGGGAMRVTFTERLPVPGEPAYEIVALDEALRALAAVDPRKSRVVELRCFGGLSVEETAAVLDVSAETIMRDWKMAKAWLARELRGSHEAPPRWREAAGSR